MPALVFSSAVLVCLPTVVPRLSAVALLRAIVSAADRDPVAGPMARVGDPPREPSGSAATRGLSAVGIAESPWFPAEARRKA